MMGLHEENVQATGEFHASLEAALEPVRDWYDEDRTKNLIVVTKDVVESLKRLRSERNAAQSRYELELTLRVNLEADVERLGVDVAHWRVAADRLAYECARAVERRTIGPRSGVGDALLDYLEVGQVDGPCSVPEWVEQYEAARAEEE